MTASAKSVKGSSQGVDYLIDEKKGYELDRNLLYGDKSAEIMQSFRMQQSLNSECNKKFITAYISGKTAQIDHPFSDEIDHLFRSKLTTYFRSKLTT